MAGSRSKCNKAEFIGPVGFEVKGASGEEQFCGTFPSERLSGPGAEFPCDVVQLFLGSFEFQVGNSGPAPLIMSSPNVPMWDRALIFSDRSD